MEVRVLVKTEECLLNSMEVSLLMKMEVWLLNKIEVCWLVKMKMCQLIKIEVVKMEVLWLVHVCNNHKPSPGNAMNACRNIYLFLWLINLK